MCIRDSVYTGPKFAIDAIAAGHEAAVSIHRFVQDATLAIGRNPRSYRELNKDDVDFGSYDTASRGDAVHDYEREKAEPFREYVKTFTEEQVRAETARCLGCGASVVDENKCIGCGLCTTKCAFDAIHPVSYTHLAKGNTLKASLRPSLPQPYLSIMKPMQPAVAASSLA